MFTFKHPKYYTELRKRNKSDQAISDSVDPASGGDNVHLVRAPSAKHQAPSFKLRLKLQAPSKNNH